MTTPLIDLTAVAAALRGHSDMLTSVTVEYPGFILVIADGAAWVIAPSTVDPDPDAWHADYYENADDLGAGASPNHSLDVDVAVTAPAADIADALFTAMSNAVQQ